MGATVGGTEAPPVETDAGASELPDAAIDAGEPPVETPRFCPSIPAPLLEPGSEGDGEFSSCPTNICAGKVLIDELDLTLFIAPDAEPTSADEYAGCTRVMGDVLINDEQATDLSALRCLERVDGTFLILKGGMLRSLDGLDQLRYVGGDLRISRKPPWASLENSITRIDALRNLHAVGGALGLHTPAVTSLEALTSLNAIGNNLELEEPTGLADLTGLVNVRAIGRNLRIMAPAADQPLWTSLAGLDQLETVGGSIEIINGVGYSTFGNVLPKVTCIGGGVYIPGPNSQLTQIDLMPMLQRVGGHIVISDNPALRAVTMLRGVEHIHGSLQIVGNLLLEDLDLSALQRIDGSFFVVSNPLLDECALLQLSITAGAVNAEIHDNGVPWLGCTQ